MTRSRHKQRIPFKIGYKEREKKKAAEINKYGFYIPGTRHRQIAGRAGKGLQLPYIYGILSLFSRFPVVVVVNKTNMDKMKSKSLWKTVKQILVKWERGDWSTGRGPEPISI